MVQNSSLFLPPSSFSVKGERMASLWASQESILELKHKLLCTTFELESARTEAKEEMRRSEDNIKQLLQLLKIACLERDEARGQLQSLLNNGLPSPHAQPVSLPPEITKENSSFKKSDNLLGAYNCHSYCPSPIDCLLDAILPAQDLPNTDRADSSVSKQAFDYGGSMSVGIVSSEAGMIDRASTVIDNLVKRKPLPQKGRLLKAVMEAGPLLQTLLLAGPLPRWQNPPPMQNWQIPAIPVPNKDGAAGTSYFEISHGYFQISSSSMTSSAHGSGSFLNRGCSSSDGTESDFKQNHIPIGKRRKL